MFVWENEKCCGNASHRRVFPQLSGRELSGRELVTKSCVLFLFLFIVEKSIEHPEDDQTITCVSKRVSMKQMSD